jgi:uncharacterized membrane protein YqgA involved in biofilm formation
VGAVIGPWVNAAALAAGALGGAALGHRLPDRLRARLPPVFGIAALGLGVVLTVRVRTLPAVMLALLAGTILGELLHLEEGIERAAVHTRRLVERLVGRHRSASPHDEAEHVRQMVSLLVLFAASATGIVGALAEGMTGDPSLLLAKAVLDMVTAAVFAATLGPAVAALALPLLAVQSALFLAVRALPVESPVLIGDLSACGGLILLATGLRVAGVRSFAVASMLPALALAIPISAAWARLWVG